MSFEYATVRRRSFERDAKVIMEVSPDGLRATIHVTPPVGQRSDITEDQIRQSLRHKGIVFGVKDDVIKRIASEKLYMKPLEVAVGQTPVDGEHARIILQYLADHRMQDRSLDNLKSVDLRELDKIVNTKAGNILVQKIPCTYGRPGTSVTGKNLRQKPGQDIRLRVGKGVKFDPVEHVYVAQRNGHVIFRNDRISVEDVFETQDVNPRTGNIRVNGTVIVHGLVNDGYTVEASGEVHIAGSVGAVTIKAGGNVIINGGICGAGACTIESTGGSVAAKFAQDATITAGSSIILEDYAKDCVLQAGEVIRVVNETRGNGFIVGGKAVALNEIQADQLGTEMEIGTEICVGIDPATLRVIEANEATLRMNQEKFEKLVRSLTFLQRARRAEGNLGEKKEEIYNKLRTILPALRASIDDTRADYHTRIERIVGHVRSKVASMRSYPGVHLRIGGEHMHVTKFEERVAYVSGKNGLLQLFVTDMDYREHLKNVDADVIAAKREEEEANADQAADETDEPALTEETGTE
ncbi:DUF342 domain-containing protein [bacterium]|nr:DUF342 domain-containing protein [bacterium]